LQSLEDPAAAERLPRLLDHLQQHPSLSAAQLMLALPPEALSPEAWAALRAAVGRGAAPLQRYRCAACGFEAQHYFWQCPGCLSWDSYPPQRIDAL
jgi:lipopolysaccharide biosynthesis regulator YciM